MIPPLPEPRLMQESVWPDAPASTFEEILGELRRWNDADCWVQCAALDFDVDSVIVGESARLARVYGWIMVPGVA